MSEKINILEILKKCPIGMELDCTIFNGKVVFEGIDESNSEYPIRISINLVNIEKLNCFGQYNTRSYAQCVIFPKGKTTWENFQIPFKNGDIITCDNGICSYTSIFKEQFGDKFYYYASIVLKDNHSLETNIDWGDFSNPRIATKEEKELLFNSLKDNDYEWNVNTKTLNKITKPKFKPEDKIKNGDVTLTIVTIETNKYVVKGDTGDFLTLSFEFQDDWELISNIKPKFKEGDTIVHKDNGLRFDIINVGNNSYTTDFFNWTTETFYPEIIPFDKQDEYVLEKFDMHKLKPFDKVLVRLDNNNSWYATLFSHIDENNESFAHKYVTIAGKSYTQMIPYKNNEYLRGTNNDCNSFYKTWEE